MNFAFAKTKCVTFVQSLLIVLKNAIMQNENVVSKTPLRCDRILQICCSNHAENNLLDITFTKEYIVHIYFVNLICVTTGTIVESTFAGMPTDIIFSEVLKFTILQFKDHQILDIDLCNIESWFYGIYELL